MRRSKPWGDPFAWDDEEPQHGEYYDAESELEPETAEYLEMAHHALNQLQHKTHKRKKTVPKMRRTAEGWN